MSETGADPTVRPLREHADILRGWLPAAGARAADIGCGGGAATRLLAREGARVVGIDPQHAVLARARRDAEDAGKAGGAVVFVAAAGEALPLADGCLDTAAWFNALHHVPVPRQDDALAECRRVLAPGGRLVVVEPLAEGPLFELVRPVEDETAVRAAAYAALGRAVAGGGWRLLHESEYDAPIRYESFEAFRDSLVAVDPSRAAAVAAHKAALHFRFGELARQVDGACWLDQPSRLTVLTRDGDAAND